MSRLLWVASESVLRLHVRHQSEEFVRFVFHSNRFCAEIREEALLLVILVLFFLFFSSSLSCSLFFYSCCFFFFTFEREESTALWCVPAADREWVERSFSTIQPLQFQPTEETYWALLSLYLYLSLPYDGSAHSLIREVALWWSEEGNAAVASESQRTIRALSKQRNVLQRREREEEEWMEWEMGIALLLLSSLKPLFDLFIYFWLSVLALSSYSKGKRLSNVRRRPNRWRHILQQRLRLLWRLIQLQYLTLFVSLKIVTQNSDEKDSSWLFFSMYLK